MVGTERGGDVMARFDVSKYATVAERLAMMEKDFPDYRLETHEYSTAGPAIKMRPLSLWPLVKKWRKWLAGR